MITTLEQLEACLGTAPAAVGMKIIDHLESEALRWLGVSRLACLGSVQPAGVAVTLAGGVDGFARAVRPTRLAIDVAAIDDPQQLRVGYGVGMLFMIPGLGETLRVNGRVANATDASVEIEIDEVYVHCAKAFMRSEFWAAAARSDPPADAAEFLNQARFLAVATADPEGHADVSPKGDPAGRLLQLEGANVSYAERPGNRRKDSLRNILTQPLAAMLAFIPGVCSVASITGSARIVSDPSVRERFSVEAKVPKLITTLEDARIALRPSAVLQRAALWPVAAVAHGIDPAAVLTAHVKLNKKVGLGATLLRSFVSKAVVNAGLARDYKKHLY
ncbi:MAG TPA: pyridoxamine 5'-phosphate oxidase family protein [Polyangiales bacterium]|nr:pyridoxamine 5'-phosphate oxidase family protein [Polyangiales bacterium]